MDESSGTPALQRARSRHGLTFEVGYTRWSSQQLSQPEHVRVFNDDPGLIAYLERTVRRGYTVVDIGACIGATCLVAAKFAGPTGRVFAFEPEDGNYARLCHHIKLNGAANVEAVQRAVGATNGMATLHVFAPDRRGWHSLAKFEAEGVRPIGQQQVSCVTLDAFCDERKLSYINLLKVDVEGAETDVFRGAEALLRAQAISCIVFEISHVPLRAMGHRPDDVLAPLLRWGFTLYTLDRDGGIQRMERLGDFQWANLVALSPSFR